MSRLKFYDEASAKDYCKVFNEVINEITPDDLIDMTTDGKYIAMPEKICQIVNERYIQNLLDQNLDKYSKKP